MKGISVVICCYNSASRLTETLRHIALQKVKKNIHWEVIIIDNNSDDDTANIAISEWGKLNKAEIDFRLVKQPIAGLSHAREKGTQVSNYDYIIFCDDDNRLFENYVEEAYFSMQQDPEIGIIGGFGIEKTQIILPDWFSKYKGFYAIGEQHIDDNNIEGNSAYVYGAGMVVRKSIFNKLNDINFKFLATDRINNKLSSGGDVELCYLANLLGYKIAYNKALKFYHFIESERLTINYIENLAFQFGYCNVIHRPYYWLFNPSLSMYKKNWFWVILISSNIYMISLLKKIKKSDSVSKINLHHAKGRLMASLKMNFKLNSNYHNLKDKFS